MKKKIGKIGYELRDIGIVQSKRSKIVSRNDARPMTKIIDRTTLPIFVAPMATVTDENNYATFIYYGVVPVVPRSAFKGDDNFTKRVAASLETFVSFSLAEVELMTRNNIAYLSDECRTLYSFTNAYQYNKAHICIDIAQGTMDKLLTVAKKLKDMLGDKVEIMAGNVANPQAYKEYCKSGIDWMRTSVGTGSRCTTSCHTGVHYPMATLLDEINIIRKKMERRNRIRHFFGLKPKHLTKVIADGGINTFDDITKSLVLGADAVMCGKMFNECEEAAYEPKFALNEEDFMQGRVYDEQNAEGTLKKYREYFGMGSEKAKRLTDSSSIFAAEGISRPTEVKYTLKELVDKIKSYLCSCMSYTNCETLDELRNNCEVVVLGGGDTQFRK